jgi:transcriptional regulator
MIKPDLWAAPAELAPGLINEIGLGELVTVDADGMPDASLLVFEAASSDRGDPELVFHIPRRFPQHADLLTGRVAMALFTGAKGYISPRWYDGPDAPTWDFESVKVTGTPEALTQEETLEHLQNLTAHNEREAEAPFSLDELDSQSIEGMLGSVSGFRIAMAADNVTVRLKLSQNRTDTELEAIRDGLTARRRPMDARLSQVIGRYAEDL